MRIISKLRKPFKFKHPVYMSEAEMICSRRYRFILAWNDMERGSSKSSFIKYTVFGSFFGGAAIGAIYTAIFGICAYFFGRWWRVSGNMELEAEIGNQNNRFQKQLRGKIINEQD